MIQANIYLNFNGTTEEAFHFYQSVFGGTLSEVFRYKDMKESKPVSPQEGEKIMHISLPIGSNALMGTDVLESSGQKLVVGNNVSISLNVDSKDEADAVYKKLSKGGKVEMPLCDTFWGAYYALFADRFGVLWMINYEYPKLLS